MFDSSTDTFVFLIKSWVERKKEGNEEGRKPTDTVKWMNVNLGAQSAICRQESETQE